MLLSGCDNNNNKEMSSSSSRGVVESVSVVTRSAGAGSAKPEPPGVVTRAAIKRSEASSDSPHGVSDGSGPMSSSYAPRYFVAET